MESIDVKNYNFFGYTNNSSIINNLYWFNEKIITNVLDSYLYLELDVKNGNWVKTSEIDSFVLKYFCYTDASSYRYYVNNKVFEIGERNYFINGSCYLLEIIEEKTDGTTTYKVSTIDSSILFIEILLVLSDTEFIFTQKDKTTRNFYISKYDLSTNTSTILFTETGSLKPFLYKDDIYILNNSGIYKFEYDASNSKLNNTDTIPKSSIEGWDETLTITTSNYLCNGDFLYCQTSDCKVVVIDLINKSFVNVNSPSIEYEVENYKIFCSQGTVFYFANGYSSGDVTRCASGYYLHENTNSGVEEQVFYVTKDGELYIKGNIEAKSITLSEDATVSGNIEATSGTIGTFEIYENAYGYGLQSEGMNDFEGLRLNGENGAIFQYSESNSKWFHLIDTTAQWCTLGDIENPNWDVVDSRNYVTIDSDSGIKISSDSQESENSLSVWRYSGAENTSDSYQNGAAIKCVVTEIGSPKNSAFLGIIASKETSDADYTYQNFRVFGQDDYGGKLVVRADNGFDSLSSAPECTLGQTNFPWTYGFFDNLKVNGTAVTSDRKAKNDIKDLSEEDAVKLIYGLDAKTFKYNNAKTGKTHMGFIAQDVASLCNDLEMPVMSLYDATVKGDDNDTPYVDGTPDEQLTWYLNYTELIAPLVKTVQSQNKKIISLEERIAKLEEIIANLAN